MLFKIRGSGLKTYYKTRKQLLKEIKILKERIQKLEKEERDRSHFNNLFPGSKTKYGMIIERQGEGIAFLDPDEKILFCNSVAEEIFGVEPGKLTGRNLREFTTPESFRRIREQTLLRRQGKRSNYYVEIIRADGEPRQLYVIATPSFNEKGHFNGTFGVFRDDSDRFRIEKALKESEERFRFLIEHAPLGIFSADTNGNLRIINPALLKILGSPSEDETKKINLLTYPRLKKAGVSRIIKECIEKGKHYSGEIPYKSHWNKEIYCMLHVYPVFDTMGKVTGLQGIVEDISERKKAEQVLVESEEKFRTLAEQSPNMIFIIKGGRIVYVNAMCEKMMGYSREELYSSDFNFITLFAPEHQDLVRENFQKHLNGQEVQPYEYSLIRKNGERIEAIITTKLINYQGKQAILGIVTDITARKKSEEVLRLRLDFEKMISTISSRFVGEYDLDEAIQSSLREMGQFSKASRTYLFLFDDDCKRMDNTHEWCAPGVTPQIDNLRDLPCDIFPWWMKKLKNDQIIYIRDIANLPPEAQTEKKILEAQDIQSLIVLPLQINGQLKGFIGFDNVEHPGEWRDEDIALLKIFSEILGNALQRYRAETALRESEERYRTIISNAHDLVWTLDRNGNFTYFNKRVEEISDYKIHELLGKNFTQYVYPEDLPKAKAAFQNVLQGNSMNYELRALSKKGEILHFSINSNPLYDGGKIVGTVGFGRDITEHKRAVEALKKSEEKFRNIVEQSTDGIVLTDEEGKIIEWNPGLERITGFRCKDVLDKPIWEIGYQLLRNDKSNYITLKELKSRVMDYYHDTENLSVHLIEKDIQTKKGWRVKIVLSTGSRTDSKEVKENGKVILYITRISALSCRS